MLKELCDYIGLNGGVDSLNRRGERSRCEPRSWKIRERKTNAMSRRRRKPMRYLRTEEEDFCWKGRVRGKDFSLR